MLGFELFAYIFASIVTPDYSVIKGLSKFIPANYGLSLVSYPYSFNQRYLKLIILAFSLFDGIVNTQMHILDDFKGIMFQITFLMTYLAMFYDAL